MVVAVEGVGSRDDSVDSVFFRGGRRGNESWLELVLLVVVRRRVSELRNDAVHVERSDVHLVATRILLLLLLSSERELVAGRKTLLMMLLSVGKVRLGDSSSFSSSSVEVELVPEVCCLSVEHRLSLLESEVVLDRRRALEEAAEVGRRIGDR